MNLKNHYDHCYRRLSCRNVGFIREGRMIGLTLGFRSRFCLLFGWMRLGRRRLFCCPKFSQGFFGSFISLRSAFSNINLFLLLCALESSIYLRNLFEKVRPSHKNSIQVNKNDIYTKKIINFYLKDS